MDILETIGWILIILAVIVFVIVWWWLVWVVAGYFMIYFNLPGGIYMQIFLWFVINLILGAIGRIGMNNLG